MKRLMHTFLKNSRLAGCLILLMLGCLNMMAQEVKRSQWTVNIEFKKGGFSGICIMQQDEEYVMGSLVNEFGIKAFDFSYQRKKGKVKLYHVMGMMNKWYIKRVLRKDLAVIMKKHLNGELLEHNNKRYKITYLFTPLANIEDEVVE